LVQSALNFCRLKPAFLTRNMSLPDESSVPMLTRSVGG
jgi:hypothetical protein